MFNLIATVSNLYFSFFPSFNKLGNKAKDSVGTGEFTILSHT